MGYKNKLQEHRTKRNIFLQEITAMTCNSPQTKSSRDAFIRVMTPERIPQFTIPQLEIQGGCSAFPTKKSTAWRSHQWHSTDENVWSRVAKRSCSDPVAKHGRSSFSYSIDDLPDPVTRAAMSLTHLSKITTPYGFVTLAESPQVASKETVFFQKRSSVLGDNFMGSTSCLQDLHLSDIYGKSGAVGAINNKSESTAYVKKSSIKKYFQDPERSFLVRRSSTATTTSNTTQEKDISLEKEFPLSDVSPLNNSMPKSSTKKTSKNLFQTVLKKHISTLKQPKSPVSDTQKKHEH